MDLLDGDVTDESATYIVNEEDEQAAEYGVSVEELEQRLADLRDGTENDSQRDAIRAIQEQKNNLAFDHFENVFRSRGYVIKYQDRLPSAEFRAGPYGVIFAKRKGTEIELTTVKNKSKKQKVH